jgi:hypothetical protein
MRALALLAAMSAMLFAAGCAKNDDSANTMPPADTAPTSPAPMPSEPSTMPSETPPAPDAATPPTDSPTDPSTTPPPPQ